MQDRVSLYPGRVTLTPVSGQANTYDMERADSPTQEGTPLNKASLLKDTTAALYGMTSAAVPDEVFAWLGKYNEHWWSSYAENAGYIADIGGMMVGDDNGWFTVAANTNRDIQYASSISVDSGGNVSLTSPSTMTIVCNGSNHSEWSTLRGKYLTNLLFDPTGIYYYGTDENDSYMRGFYATGGQYIDQNVVNIHGIYEVVTQYYSELGEFIGYVQSTDRNAYPDSGTVSGIHYQYLGVPFEKFPTMPRIVTGSYTGTGTYGPSNPNTLTFEFAPFMVFIYSQTTGFGVSASGRTVMFSKLLSTQYTYFTGFNSFTPSSGYGKKSSDGKTFYWYNSDSTEGAARQFNYSGAAYYYVALG